MKIGKRQLVLLAAAALATTPLAAQAQGPWWQQHPAYLHAMADLRSAYWLVQHREERDPVAKIEEQRASRAIRAAYQNLKDASIVDDKDIDAQPLADPTWADHRGRLHKAMDLLHDAHNEVAREEDDRAARGFKARALRQIDAAAGATDAAINAWRF